MRAVASRKPLHCPTKTRTPRRRSAAVVGATEAVSTFLVAFVVGTMALAVTTAGLVVATAARDLPRRAVLSFAQPVTAQRRRRLAQIAPSPPSRASPFSALSAATTDDSDGVSSPLVRPATSGGVGLRLPGSVATSSPLQQPPPPPILFVAAPMVAASDYAFRCLCRQHGVHLTYTQMLHARHLLEDPSFVRNHADWHECGSASLNPLPKKDEDLLPAQRKFWGDPNPLISLPPDLEPFVSGPLVVQLAGHDVDYVVRAAHLVLERTGGQVAGIDLNLGCPQNIARKGHYGAFLAERDEELVCHILSALRSSMPTSVAVSAKIRLPLDRTALPDRVRRLLDTGIDFLTVHARTLEENKTRVGPARLDQLRRAIEIAQEHRPGFPVVANGGVETRSDANRILCDTGAAAVMSSEALLERPDVFAADDSSIAPAEPRQLLHHQLQLARDYLMWSQVAPPLPGVLGHETGTANVARGHLFKLLHRFLNRDHPDLREFLASPKFQTLQHAHQLVDELERRTDLLSDAELELQPSVFPDASWYRRHWKGGAKATLAVASSTNQRANTATTDSAVAPADATHSLQQRKEDIRRRILDLQQQRRGKVGAAR